MKKISKVNYSAITFLITLSFFVRLFFIDRPIIDNHAWKQTVTYSIAKNFVKNPNILEPQSSQKCKISVGPCFFFAEFPLYEYSLSILFRLLGENIIIARLLSISFMGFTSVFIYFIGKKLFNIKAGIFSGIVFNLIPFSIFWGRTIVPETLAIALSTLSIVLTIYSPKALYKIGAIALSLAILIKPYFAILLLPLILFLFKSNDKKSIKIINILFFILISLLPYVVWLIYIAHIPVKHIVESHSLFGYRARFLFFSAKNPLGFFIQYKYWFRTIFYDRFIGGLTPFGLFLFMISVLHLANKEKVFLFLWLIAVVSSLFIVADGNLEHEYYMFILFPAISISIGGYLSIAFSKIKYKYLSRWHLLFFIFFLVIFGLFPLIFYLKDRVKPEVKFYSFLPDIKKISAIIPENSPVITHGGYLNNNIVGSPVLLNHLGRSGWIINGNAFCKIDRLMYYINKYQRLGVSFFVFQKTPYYFAENDFCDRSSIFLELKRIYSLVYEGENLAIFKLSN